MGKVIRLNLKQSDECPKAEQCYQMKNGRPWCPQSKWYLKDGCPFKSRSECDTYKAMCSGKLF